VCLLKNNGYLFNSKGMSCLSSAPPVSESKKTWMRVAALKGSNQKPAVPYRCQIDWMSLTGTPRLERNIILDARSDGESLYF